MSENISPNSTLSHYKILSRLGAGGMGEVYLAEDTKLDRQVALKVLPQEFAEDKDRMNRFVREAKSASALNHPNIITIHEIGEANGTHFIASEYVQGDTLHARLKGRPLDLKSTLDVAVQVASALNAAHKAGIIHRDIKPENLMIRPDGLVKILDFGIAKLSEERRGDWETRGRGEDQETLIAASPRLPVSASSKTDPGVIIGTANYMSPEQARGKDVSTQSDIFSFGIVLYEMVTGQRAFSGENALDVIGAILHKEPTPLNQHSPELPHEIERIINKTLRKDPDARYQTAGDLLTDLKDARQDLQFQDQLERTAAPLSDKPKTLSITVPSTDAQSTPTSSAEFITQEVKKHKLGVVLGALIILALLGGGLWFFYPRAAAGNAPIASIAVMPFVNASGNADAEYLSDGMTETLISSLSQLQNLNVRPRSSVFRYKGKDTNPKTIGNELNVQAILNGRVTQRGQDLSLFVELIDVALDKVVWSQQYNRKQSDLVTLQTDIARDVSSRLTTKLSGTDEAKVTKTYTTNPEAYQLYLKGKYYQSKYNEDSYQKAIDHYQQAIDIDPNYALAYLGLAEVYNNASDWYLAPAVAMPKAKAAVVKAIELDNTLAQSHHELGILIFWYDWDWAAAEREMKRAVELDPNYTMYGLYLAAMGKPEEAIRAQEMTNRRSPLDLQFGMDLAGIYLAAGRVDQAIEQARKTIELDPNYWGGYQELGLALLRNKQFPEAIAAMEKSRSLDNNPSVSGYLGFAYAEAGKKAEAQRVLDELKELSKKQYVPAYSIAIIYAGLNDKDQAFEWLNKAYTDRSFYIALLNFESTLDNLRSDSRFKELLKRANLTD